MKYGKDFTILTRAGTMNRFTLQRMMMTRPKDLSLMLKRSKHKGLKLDDFYEMSKWGIGYWKRN
jgi:hypothetical protein